MWPWKAHRVVRNTWTTNTQHRTRTDDEIAWNQIAYQKPYFPMLILQKRCPISRREIYLGMCLVVCLKDRGWTNAIAAIHWRCVKWWCTISCTKIPAQGFRSVLVENAGGAAPNCDNMQDQCRKLRTAEAHSRHAAQSREGGRGWTMSSQWSSEASPSGSSPTARARPREGPLPVTKNTYIYIKKQIKFTNICSNHKAT